jgi:serine/threonine protein phosphatase PrpC
MTAYTASIIGLRPTNEDTHFLSLNINNKNPNLKPINFIAVFDGHGGKSVSKYLENNLPLYFVGKKVKYPLQTNYITAVYDKLQSDVIKHKIGNRTGSTSLVVAHFKLNNDDYINVINLGDCRCVMNRDKTAMTLTDDHKPNWPAEKHRIEKLGGVIKWDGHDYRIKDLSVSRAFGDTDTTPYLTHLPDIFKYKLNAANKFIVVGCDGLWDVMSDQEVVNFVLLHCYDNNLKNRINKHINIARKLANYAFKNKGSTDNITVVVYFIR